MLSFDTLKPKRVFEIFYELSQICRGSGNMNAVADYCVSFAKKNSLKYIRDELNNVIIFKDASSGYEKSEPIILQGHLDMVCQKNSGSQFDFLKDGLNLYIDGDFLKAKDTTLGADNGIAVAMTLAVLESQDIAHPPIEAVFTTDEEIGMIGAIGLDMTALRAKKMVNIDSEKIDTVTVSCAGGSEVSALLPITLENVEGTEVLISIQGLLGGHSGIMIDKNRVNADILAGRFLNFMKANCNFSLLCINGGDKSNAIPLLCDIRVCTDKPEEFKAIAEDYLKKIKAEISSKEPKFIPIITILESGVFKAIKKEIAEKLIATLIIIPNGVMEMSAEISGLVETSLNLGILKTSNDGIVLCSALRSNKKSALVYLEERLYSYYSRNGFEVKAFGHYPPWEYNGNSELIGLYKECYKERFATEPKVEAIHAGLECGVFADNIEGFDCIAIGPQIFDAHTTNERLSISSTEQCFDILKNLLSKLK